LLIEWYHGAEVVFLTAVAEWYTTWNCEVLPKCGIRRDRQLAFSLASSFKETRSAIF